MSVVAIAGGVLLYRMLRSYLLVCDGPPLVHHLRGQRIFQRVLVALSSRMARRLEEFLGTRRLQPQLQLLVCTALLVGIAPLYTRGLGAGEAPHTTFDLPFAALWAVGVACALGAAYQAKFHRLAALILLGGAGLVTCISLVWLSAPDLALTQLVVETVTTVLLLLGLRWLPPRMPNWRPPTWPTRGIRWYRLRDFAISVTAGVGLAALAYAVMVRPGPASIAGFFVENAYTRGGGTNVVNVILVDFRGFDTFGEIAVLGIVGLTAYALLRRFRPAPDILLVPEQQRAQNAQGGDVTSTMAVPALIVKLLFPVISVTAMFLLFRGHDFPGGGFVAGVTMATAFILQYMGHGTIWVEVRFRILPVRWMGVGLLLAASVGAAAWLFGRPFLTSSFSYLQVPLIGPVPMASAFLFDLAIFALVMGATVLMLIALAHQSVRGHRPSRGKYRPRWLAQPGGPKVE
jgi:multicomponent K+:H+ antiporter subunit A